MKKCKILALFLILTFLFMENVNASSKIECSTKNVIVGNTFTCDITTDEKISVTSSFEIIKADKGEIKDKTVTFLASGSVTYKAESKGTYTIKISNDTFKDEVSVVVKEQTTTSKPPVSTTTTTKAKSNNNYLSSILVDGEKIGEFDKNKTKYSIAVDNEIEKISINAVAEDALSKVEINGPKKLVIGDNEYTIGITSEDNTTKFYKVIVTREEPGKSSDTNLTNIKIKGYSLGFDKNSKTFYLTIDKDDEKIDIEVITNNKKASYEVTGNESLKDGSEIKIKVTAENGDEDTYRIIIQKEQSNILPVIISVVVIGIIVIVIIVALIMRNKKRKNNKRETNKKNKKQMTKKVDVIDQSTKELSAISIAEEMHHVDNDDEETTRFLSYDEQEELEKTKILDLGNEAENNDEDLEKTMLFDEEKNIDD